MKLKENLECLIKPIGTVLSYTKLAKQSAVCTQSTLMVKVPLMCSVIKKQPGGWTVFQKRLDGSVYFYRSWDDYKNGFGDLNGEFWLGLDKIYRLTEKKHNRLRVDLEDFTFSTAYAEYDIFEVTNETTKYKLSLGMYSGTAGDSLSEHRGHPFTTKDRDHDENAKFNCAAYFKGAWWYTNCHASNLNGLYYNGSHAHKGQGIIWHTWKGNQYSVKRAEMKIRPANF
ncbi:unnamed protein product [Porites lobata]|uniref:Fibrinogen C-terminal domain-containing protein n=1 Tax=Porites lobata TaxID=104759 RepID=A0ABN8RPP6_9CNID|nr:unnamed protein product [Porites lobata]